MPSSIRLLSILLLLALMLSLLPPYPVLGAARSDWEIGREEWFLRICGDESNDGQDVRIRRLLDMLDYRAQNYLRIMDTSGNAKRLFHNSNTDNTAISASADMTREYDYLRQIALAYGTYGTKYYKDPDVQAKLLYGVKWLNEHYYGEKQTYGKGTDGWHLMTGFNWWDWYIGTPQHLYDILIILDHFDLLTDSMINTYLAPVKYVIDDPDGMYRYYVDNDETYDHKVKHIVIMLGYSLLKEDRSMMSHLVEDVKFCMQVSPTGNGIREDGSYRFHEYHAMEGTYGADVLVNRIIQTTGILHATSFVDPIGQAALAGQVDWFTEIFAPVMHNGVVMAQSNGRMPQNGIGNGNLILQGALGLVGLYPEKDASLRRFVREQMGDNNLSSFDMIYYQSVLNEVQDEARADHKEEYARTRYTTDRVVQHREEYTAGLALSSNRTIRYECINNCNMKGWYTGDGMLYVYTDKTTQKFDEYGSEYFSNVNMYRLPGTTEDIAPRKECSISGTYRHHLIPNESFVGGVQFDDDYATIAYDFAAYNSTGNEGVADTGYGGGNPAVTSDLKAKKSYFFFDNEIVCLGAGITSTNPSDIRTYVDNRQLLESAIVDGALVYGTEDITVDGVLMDKSAAYTESFTDPRSVYVEGFGGYYFPNGGKVTLNKTDGSVPFYELWLDHGLKPTAAAYSYVMLPSMEDGAVAAYAQKPEIEIIANNASYQVVRDVSTGVTGLVFWKAGSCSGITVDQPLTIMLREQDGRLQISVADPTQALTTATVTIPQRLYATATDEEIAVTENDLDTKLVIDFASAGGKSVTAEFGQKSTRELLFSFTGTAAEKQSYATATYGGNDFGNAYSWQSNGSSARPTISASNGGTLTVHLVDGKTYHWLQVTDQNHNLITHPLQYIPREDDVVQLRFKLENCTVSDDAQLWFLYIGTEETVDTFTPGQIVKQTLPTDCQMGEYVVLTFRNLPSGYSALGLLTSFRLHFYNVTAGADAKLIIDSIYIGGEANAPANAPLYFDFGGSATEQYRYTDASYGSGAYDFADAKYWACHANRTKDLNISDGILSFTVSSDESWGSSSWLRPSNGRGSNTAFLLNLNRSNMDVVQLRLRITGTLRDNSDMVVYLSKETNKFTTLAVAKRELLKTGEFYILELPANKSISEEWYGLFSLDTHNMQGCKVEIDYLYIGNQANAPRTEGLYMDFTNSMSDVYRYNLPQYLSFNFDDSYHWAANLSRSSRPVVNAQSGCLEYRLINSQTWLRPSIGRNNSQDQSLSYKPSDRDVFQIHFRADGFTGTSGTLRALFTDGTKQSNGWFVFQDLTEGISIKPKDGQFITLTLPLTDAAKAATLQGITLDFYSMTGCELYIDSIYMGPADGAPCCTADHRSITTNGKAPDCTEEGYSGDSFCELCTHRTAKGFVQEKVAHTYSYTRLDYSHKALCSVCNEVLWEPHWYGNTGLCQCGAREAEEPGDYLFMGFENDGEAQGRYNSYAYCGYNYDTSTCWGYNNLRSTAPTVNAQEGSLSFRVIDTTSWVRPSLSKRSVGYTNLYFPTSKIEAFQIRLKLLRETANPNESIQLSYTTGTYNSSNGNPIYSTIKSFSTAQINAIPNGEYVTLTVPLTDYKFVWDTMRGYNLNFSGMKDTTVTIDYIYFGSWARITSCKEGHSYTSKVTTAATCTDSGIEAFTCTACGHSYSRTLAATGHTAVTDQAIPATCTNAGKTEGSHCSACNAILTAQADIPPTGHSSVYTPVDEDKHIITCKNCDYSETVAHSYSDGSCICGQSEVKEPVEEPKWIIGHTLNLASDISINFACSKACLDGFDMDTVYVLSEVDLYEGNIRIGTETVKLPVEQGEYYYFTLGGLTAVNMNDRISSVLYGTKDGQIYYSPVDEYSIAEYAYSQMNKSGVSESLKTLCADLLRYGGRAQVFKSYRTDALADADMTEVHRTYLSDLDAVGFGSTNTVKNDLENAAISWKGKALDLASKVSVKFIFSMESYTGSREALSLRVSYKDIHGTAVTQTLNDAVLYNEEKDYYAFTLDTLLAAELRSVLSVQVYQGEVPVSCTLQYSADTYGNNKTGPLEDLCRALFAYSDSAKVYFTQ